MEYDVVHALQPAGPAHERGENADVSGYIIFVGGAQSFTAPVSNQAGGRLNPAAIYSTPRVGAISYIVDPAG